MDIRKLKLFQNSLQIFFIDNYSAVFNPAIEGILETDRWDIAIDKTETMITSWKDRQRRGNLCGELNR